MTNAAKRRSGAELAQVLDRAARELVSRDGGVAQTLDLIVAGAIHSIPHVEQAGISLVERGATVTSRAPSNDVVRQLDELQNELGEGPCWDSIWDEERTVIDDLAMAGDRWPGFAPQAVARGMRTMMAFQLFASHGNAGALNLYASHPHAFDDDTADTGSLFASHAALALHGAQQAGGLATALRNRDVIGQAKGILIERFTLAEPEAFAMLVRSSQQTNLKLVDVAMWLVAEATRGRSGPPTRRASPAN